MAPRGVRVRSIACVSRLAGPPGEARPDLDRAEHRALRRVDRHDPQARDRTMTARRDLTRLPLVPQGARAWGGHDAAQRTRYRGERDLEKPGRHPLYVAT